MKRKNWNKNKFVCNPDFRLDLAKFQGPQIFFHIIISILIVTVKSIGMAIVTFKFHDIKFVWTNYKSHVEDNTTNL